ncbi:7056_t:CDS:10 [Ambispora gerdemannii]|uniref:Rab escort protein 1 n=1 Tax=Ambispora gerdemannii TaxID=144530 RepID=A0A9N8W771_9GLOM|nr:7056_t:CDS:10 [Ambispora gerdemannii]
MTQPLEVTEYDVIVLGTGFTESLLAGALARTGKSVLHLDANSHYGGGWSALNFRDLFDWIQNTQGPVADTFGSNQESIEGRQALAINVSQALKQVYPTIEYEIFPLNQEKDQSALINPTEESIQDEDQNTPSDFNALAKYLLSSDEYDHNESIGKLISEQFRSKLLIRTRENEDAIAMESARLVQLLQIHKGSNNITEDAIRHVSTCLSNLEQIETLAVLLGESKRYNLELAPKLMPCRGELVELLISSGVGKYLDFKAVEQTFIYLGADEFEKVPCSKEDVFTSQTVSLVDKRKLMKFLTFALDYTNSPETYAGYEDKSFKDFLKEKFRIEGKLLAVILYAIALINSPGEDVYTMQGLKKTQEYLRSLGRYGNNAFLVALYGGGSEIAQGFCRVCAVYGGIYMLSHSTNHLLIEENSNKFIGLMDANEQQLSSTYLVSSIDYLPSHYLEREELWEKTSRAIIIIDQPIHKDSDATITIYPPGTVNNPYSIYVIQLTHDTQTCPEDRSVLYMFTKSSEKKSPKEDLYKAFETLANISRKPQIARLLFEKMYPGEEFLPPGPELDDEGEDFEVN